MGTKIATLFVCLVTALATPAVADAKPCPAGKKCPAAESSKSTSKPKGSAKGRMCSKDKDCASGSCKMENRTRGRCQ